MNAASFVYGSCGADFSARVKALDKQFRSRYRCAPARWFSASGRAEIVGNHTDHNLGKVLVAAVSCDILAAVAPRTDGVTEIAADGYRPVRIGSGDLAARTEERGHSAALVRGVLRAVADMGYSFGGFSAVTHSNIFRGAGLSSSAAFEVLIAEIVNGLYLRGALTPAQKARAGQFAENEYFGKPCGLLDQTGVALGGLHKVDFLHPEAPCAERLPWLSGYETVVVNTGGSHAKLTAHYAAIRNEMRAVAAFFGKEALRFVAPEEVDEAAVQLRKRLGDRAVLRAMHYFEENERVEAAARALRAGREDDFLRAVRESGESSVKWLQNCCVPGRADQPVLFALKLAEKLTAGRGAFRMQGGGFAGTVIAVLPREATEAYARGMARVFGEDSVLITDVREEGACELR